MKSTPKFSRTRGYYRHHRQRVIQRKKKLVNQLQWYVRHNQYGRLSKDKIHCSCSMCSAKTRSLGLPKLQLVRLEALEEQLIDLKKGC